MRQVQRSTGSGWILPTFGGTQTALFTVPGRLSFVLWNGQSARSRSIFLTSLSELQIDWQRTERFRSLRLPRMQQVAHLYYLKAWTVAIVPQWVSLRKPS